MCNNDECPLKENCYRYKATPNAYYQAYQTFQPDLTYQTDPQCDYFIKSKEEIQ